MSDEILGLAGFHCRFRYGESDQSDMTQAILPKTSTVNYNASAHISCPSPAGIVGRAIQANKQPAEPIVIQVSLLSINKNPEQEWKLAETNFALADCRTHSTCRRCLRWQGLCFWSRQKSGCLAERSSIAEQGTNISSITRWLQDWGSNDAFWSDQFSKRSCNRP